MLRLQLHRALGVCSLVLFGGGCARTPTPPPRLAHFKVAHNVVNAKIFEARQGSVFVAGTYFPNLKDPYVSEFYVEKEDQSLRVVWARTWNGGNSARVSINVANGASLNPGPRGGVTVVGSCSRLGSGHPEETQGCAWSVDAQGKTLWTSNPVDVGDGIVISWNSVLLERGENDSVSVFLAGTGYPSKSRSFTEVVIARCFAAPELGLRCR